jgi:hypothetical protein
MSEAGEKVAALLDTARALTAAGIPYALIGGVAVGIHSGVPRATADTGVAVRSTADHAAIRRALLAAGFQCAGEFRHSQNYRHASGEPVQIIFDPQFDAMIERAERFDVSCVAVRIVRKSDLIAMKQRSAGDPSRRRSKALQDQADLELLQGDVPDPDEGW